LIDKRQHSNRVESYKWDDCDIDHYQVVAKVRERLSVSKRTARKFDMEIFNLKNPSHVKVKDKYQIKLSDNSAALGNLDDDDDDDDDDDVDISTVWESTWKYTKASAIGCLRY